MTENKLEEFNFELNTVSEKKESDLLQTALSNAQQYINKSVKNNEDFADFLFNSKIGIFIKENISFFENQEMVENFVLVANGREYGFKFYEDGWNNLKQIALTNGVGANEEIIIEDLNEELSSYDMTAIFSAALNKFDLIGQTIYPTYNPEEMMDENLGRVIIANTDYPLRTSEYIRSMIINGDKPREGEWGYSYYREDNKNFVDQDISSEIIGEIIKDRFNLYIQNIGEEKAIKYIVEELELSAIDRYEDTEEFDKDELKKEFGTDNWKIILSSDSKKIGEFFGGNTRSVQEQLINNVYEANLNLEEVIIRTADIANKVYEKNGLDRTIQIKEWHGYSQGDYGLTVITLLDVDPKEDLTELFDEAQAYIRGDLTYESISKSQQKILDKTKESELER